MIGNTKNRGKHGSKECEFGCCRSLITGNKAKTRRILRAREKVAWKKEA